MHLCCTVFGYAALMASFIPDSPSEQIIKISFTPRFFKSFNTPSQNLADSFSPIHILSISFFPSESTPSTIRLLSLLSDCLV